MRDNRGQAFTLEAVAAALLLAGVLAFIVSATAVTPFSASFGGTGDTVSDEKRSAQAFLETQSDKGNIKQTLLYWSDQDEKFHHASGTYYTDQMPPTPFGEALDDMYVQNGYEVNIDAVYLTAPSNDNRERRVQPVVNSGTAPSDAITVQHSVTVYNSDPVYDENLNEYQTLGETSYYAPNVENTELYNIIIVEVTIWEP